MKNLPEVITGILIIIMTTALIFTGIKMSGEKITEPVSSMPTLAVVETFPEDSSHVVVTDDTSLVFTEGRSMFYIYEPKPDITIYELALIIPLFTSYSHYAASLIEDLPPGAKRHFRREPPEEED